MRSTNRQRAILKSLRSKKGRDETGLFLIEGARLCEELAASGLPIEMVLVSDDARDKLSKLLSRFESANVPVLDAKESEIQQISDTVTSQGIVAAARWKDANLGDLKIGKRCRILALDNVADPGNVGAVIRCADWFGVDAVLLGRGCADLLNPKTVRSTMGSMFHLPILKDVPLPETLRNLKSKGFSIAAATMDGSADWQKWSRPDRAVLILGSEAHGVSPDVLSLSDVRITIPRRGKAESLNVAVAAGILLS